MADPGTVVSIGTPSQTFTGLDGCLAVLDVPPDFLALLKLGDTLAVTGRGSAPVSGGLHRIEPSARTGTRKCCFRLPRTDPPLSCQLGGLVFARLAGANASGVTSPLRTITGSASLARGHRSKGGPGAGDSGQTFGDQMGITAGLARGDEIVVRGALVDGRPDGWRIRG